MKKRMLLIVVILAALLISSVPASAAGETHSFLVLGAKNQLPAGLEAKVTAAGGTFEYTIPQIGIAVVSGDDTFAASIAKLSGVSSVVANVKFHTPKPLVIEEATADFGNPPNSGEDDVFFDLQWGHDAVNAPEAWAAGYTGAGALVAVLDEGVDYTNPDLAPNFNHALSASFVPGETYGADLGPGPYFNHGTHVAGTIAAADNGFGVIGIAPEAEIMSVKVLSEVLGYGEFAWVLQGMVYATDMGADVINMSLGGYDDFSTYGSESAQLLVAFNRASNYAFQNGTLIVTSAGNDAIDRDHDADGLNLPTDASHVLTIAATGPYGWGIDPTVFLSNPSIYTNYGQSSIDFAAPGGDYLIYFYPEGHDLCTVSFWTRPCYVFDFVMSDGAYGSMYWAVGTSMAAPHVSGIAALIIGANGGDMNPALVEKIIQSLSVDYGKPGNDDFYGNGFVQAPTE